MQVFSSVISTVITLIFNIILDKYGGTPALASIGGVVAVGTIFSLFIFESLNKTNLKMRLGTSSFCVSLVPVPHGEEDNDYEYNPVNKSDKIGMKSSSHNTSKTQ